MLTVETITERERWNTELRRLPYAHILQTWEWGEFKRVTTDWTPLRLAFLREGELAGMVSIGMRNIGPLRVLYAPKGPALDYTDTGLVTAVLDRLRNLANEQRAIWLKIDPDVVEATGIPTEADERITPEGQATLKVLRAQDWRYSNDQIQFRNTITIYLGADEDQLLAQMSQNTRRKVRTADKKGVVVREGTPADLPALYRLYQETGERDQFLIRPPAYYEQAWRSFMEAGLAHALIAEFEGRPIAHVILFHFGQKCWYFYGASANAERERMPNYLLQWEAIRWAKAQGYAIYDMWGAPDVFDESDSMWGVYEFKRGFRGTVIRHIGAWDYAPSNLLYAGYNRWWPWIRRQMRRRHDRQ